MEHSISILFLLSLTPFGPIQNGKRNHSSTPRKKKLFRLVATALSFWLIRGVLARTCAHERSEHTLRTYYRMSWPLQHSTHSSLARLSPPIKCQSVSISILIRILHWECGAWVSTSAHPCSRFVYKPELDRCDQCIRHACCAHRMCTCTCVSERDRLHCIRSTRRCVR